MDREMLRSGDGLQMFGVVTLEPGDKGGGQLADGGAQRLCLLRVAAYYFD